MHGDSLSKDSKKVTPEIQNCGFTLISLSSSGVKSPLMSTIKGQKLQSYSDNSRKNLQENEKIPVEDFNERINLSKRH